MRQWIILRIKIWVQPELDRTRGLLRQANIALDKALRENTHLKNRNDELNTKVNGLESDVRDLQRDLEREKQSKSTQQEVIARMEQNQERMDKALAKAEAMIDSLKERVIKLDAERGKWTDFGSNGPKNN